MPEGEGFGLMDGLAIITKMKTYWDGTKPVVMGGLKSMLNETDWSLPMIVELLTPTKRGELYKLLHAKMNNKEV